MKYKIERQRTDGTNEWVGSQDYPETYSEKESDRIIERMERMIGTRYRKMPVTPALRQVTREEFLETLVDEAKERITFARIHKYLPFAIRIMEGSTKKHIVNDSVYAVQTEKRNVADGEPLCGRVGDLYIPHGYSSHIPCPGCLAIARGLAVRDLV